MFFRVVSTAGNVPVWTSLRRCCAFSPAGGGTAAAVDSLSTACQQLLAALRRMDRMVMQASQKSLMLLADSMACGGTPFATWAPQVSAAQGICTPCCSGTYLQQLTSYQNSYHKLSQSASVPPSMQQYHPQMPPLQHAPPSRNLPHSPYLPPLRTLRSRGSGSRLYSVQSVGGVQQIEEPIIVAASWLGAKRGPFSK